MPQTPHIERHFTGTATVRDIVIGMSDGLTVPFALAAGLSGAVDSTRIIVTAGLAEIAAGALSTWLRGVPRGPNDARAQPPARQRHPEQKYGKPRQGTAREGPVSF